LRIFSHDIVAGNSSIVPLIISGSNEIQKKEINSFKITDIFPTLLKLLGSNSAKNVMGKSLI